MWWCSSRLALVCLALLLLQGHLSSARRGGGGRGRSSSRRSSSRKYSSSYRPSRRYNFRSSYNRPYVGGGYSGNPGISDWSSLDSSVVSQPKPNPFDDEIVKTCRELLGMESKPARSSMRGDEGGVSGRTGAGRDDRDARGTTPEPRTEGSQPSATTVKPILTTEGKKMDTDFDEIMTGVKEWALELKRSMTPLCRHLFRLRSDLYQA